MPLKKGGKTKKSKQAAMAYNMHELKHHGTRPRSQAQKVAIAMKAAGLSKYSKKKKKK